MRGEGGVKNTASRQLGGVGRVGVPRCLWGKREVLCRGGGGRWDVWLPWCPNDKESTCNAGDPGSIPGWGRFPGKGIEWQPTSIFLPRKFQGQRNPVGYSPWSRKESDMTE